MGTRGYCSHDSHIIIFTECIHFFISTFTKHICGERYKRQFFLILKRHVNFAKWDFKLQFFDCIIYLMILETSMLCKCPEISLNAKLKRYVKYKSWSYKNNSCMFWLMGPSAAVSVQSGQQMRGGELQLCFQTGDNDHDIMAARVTGTDLDWGRGCTLLDSFYLVLIWYFNLTYSSFSICSSSCLLCSFCQPYSFWLIWTSRAVSRRISVLWVLQLFFWLWL